MCLRLSIVYGELGTNVRTSGILLVDCLGALVLGTSYRQLDCFAHLDKKNLPLVAVHFQAEPKPAK